jgi:hypothetical protein
MNKKHSLFQAISRSGMAGFAVLLLAVMFMVVGCDTGTGSGGTGTGSTTGKGSTLTINNISGQNGKYAFAYAEAKSGSDELLCLGSFGATEDAPINLVQVNNGSVILNVFRDQPDGTPTAPKPYTGSGSFDVYVIYTNKRSNSTEEFGALMMQLIMAGISGSSHTVTFTNGSGTLNL